MHTANVPCRLTLAGALLALAGCADLATEATQVPAELTIEPRDTLITQGDQLPLRITVFDQDGAPMGPYPRWAPPAWSISDPTSVSVSPLGVVDALDGGEVRVNAELAGLPASFRLRVNPREVVLRAPTVYLVQSIQNTAGDVPIVAGRRALLRVFAHGDRISFYRPRARVTFFLGGTEVLTVLMEADSEQLPAGVEEGRIDRSFNAVVPAELVRPGLEAVVELDPEAVVPRAPGSALRVPASGRLRFDIREVAPLELTVVPIMLSMHPDERIFDWTDGLGPDSRQLDLARQVHPIAELRVRIHDTYVSGVDLTTESGWSSLLREMDVLRAVEGRRGYYYGTAQLPPRSAWGGLGFVGWPVSVGAPSESTFAHELGHNLSLRHAPCGSVSGADANFPYSGGRIGVWGFDFVHGATFGYLVPPTQYVDLMGYCSPRWVSDYHFKKALTFRLNVEDSLVVRPASPAPEADEPGPVLLVWGGSGPEGLVLEPAFATEAPPLLPESDGPYLLEGFDAGGTRRLSLRFAARETSEGGRSFAFAVPMERVAAEGLERLVLSGPEGRVTRVRSREARSALILDEATGRLRAVVREWPAAGLRPAAGARVRLSDGLPVPPGSEELR